MKPKCLNLDNLKTTFKFNHSFKSFDVHTKFARKVGQHVDFIMKYINEKEKSMEK